MKVYLTKNDFFRAFRLADHGGRGYVRKGTNFLYGVTLEARGKTLYIRTEIEEYDVPASFEAEAPASVLEEGEYTIDLDDFRDAAKRLEKSRQRNELVKILGDETRAGRSLHIEYGCVRTSDMRELPTEMRVPAFEVHRDGASVSFAEIAAIHKSLSGIPVLNRGESADAPVYYAASVGICDGIALITDGTVADVVSLMLIPSSLYTAIPRSVIAALSRSGSAATVSDATAVAEWIRAKWRVNPNDPSLRNVRMVSRIAGPLRKGRPVTLPGVALRQALREMTAFCKAGDAIRLLPHEAGVKLLRYDCKDGRGADLCSVPCAETLCEADWPVPRPMTVSGKALKKALGDADSLELYATPEDGDPVAVRVPDSHVFRIMCECPCAFEDRTSI